MPQHEIIFNHCSGLPVTMSIQKVLNVACHWHSALEIIWVLDGAVDLYEGPMYFQLKPGDIYVVNYNETHRIFTRGNPATLLFFYLDPTYFTNNISNLMEISFSHYCHSTRVNIGECLNICRTLLSNLYQLMQSGKSEFNNKNQIESIAKVLLTVLVSNFQLIYFKKNEVNNYQDSLEQQDFLSPKDLERLHRITHYIYMHCDRKLTLEELAQKEYYSKFYISHFITKAQGLNFQETLSFSRVCVSERLLIGTSKTIDEIASLAGFSNRQAYCSHFKKWHGILPTEFRKQNRPGASGNIDQNYECSNDEIEELISRYIKSPQRNGGSGMCANG